MDKIKIIIISSTPWDETNSFGNSFTNIFGDSPFYEIANIYCDTGFPRTKVCTRYFQITEKGIIKNLVNSKYNSGNEVSVTNNVTNGAVTLSANEIQYLNILKRIRLQIFIWIRDFIWSVGTWKSLQLNQFILDFRPDLIFLPIYYSTYMNNVGLYTQKRAGVKMAGYISDDNYTLKQFSLSPLFWIDRLIKRKYVKKSIDACEILYVITQRQKEEYNKIFGNKCKILFKGGQFLIPAPLKLRSSILKLVYTGNIYDSRWKILELIGKVLKRINDQEIKAQLFIYSQSLISQRIKKRLNISNSLFFMGGISYEKIKEVQADADILVHVESFLMSEKHKSRLSLSTKIVDYLERGRCLLAIGWNQSGGIEYLKNNDAAFVITSKSMIELKIRELLGNPDLIDSYAHKSLNLGRENHQIQKIKEMLYFDLKSLCKGDGTLSASECL